MMYDVGVTYEQLEDVMEALGYDLATMTPEEVEDIAEVEGFSRSRRGNKYYYIA